MANPNERKGKSTAVRSGELLNDAKNAVEQGGGFAFKSWSEAAMDLGSAVGRPTASNMANAQALRDFLDQVLKVLPDDGEIQQKEQKMKQFVAAKLDTLPKHYDGAWIQGRTSMCSNTRCRGPAV